MKKMRILIAAVISGVFLFAGKNALAEDKPAVPDSLVNELRPRMEFAGDTAKEPFEDAFSKINEPEKIETKPVVKEQRPVLPQMTVQGIIWGSSVPCVIINNKVLKEGDKISEAKIIKIGKEGVQLSYKDWDYNLTSPAQTALTKDPKEEKK